MANVLLQIVFKRKILSNKDCLPVFLHHVEVICGIDTPLEQDSTDKSLSASLSCVSGG